MSKKIFCLLIALLMVLTVSCVSAAEYRDNSTAAVDEQVTLQIAMDDVQLEMNYDDADVLSAGSKDPNFNMKPSCNDYGDVSFWASTEKDATGTVHVKFILKSPGGDTVEADETLDLVNGSVSWGGAGNYLPKGSYTVQATYSGDDNYASAYKDTPDTGPDAFNVPKYPIHLNFTNVAVNEKGNIVVNGQLDNEKADGPYVLTFTNKDNGKTETWYRQQVQAGGIIVNEKTPNLGGGEYIVSISYVGTDQYFPAAPQEKNINISDIVIKNDKIKLGVGDEIESGASLNPADAGNLTFASSNESVVTVDANTGVITAVGLGDATVIVSCAGNDKYGPAVNKTIAVSVNIPVNITVDPAEVALYIGENLTLNANLTPADAGNLTFVSSNPKVVNVTADGLIIAVGEGNAKITVSFPGTEVYAASDVVVPVNVSLYDASVSAENMELTIGENGTISYTTEPTGLNVTFVPDDSGIVNVTDDGLVTAIKQGTANITINVEGNKKYAFNSTIITVTVSLYDASVSAEDMELTLDKNATISYTTEPTGLNVTFVADNSGVVEVNDNGLVTPIKEGTAYITINVGDNETYALNSTVITVTVSKIATEILIQNTTLDMVIDDVVDPVVSLMPSNAGNLSFNVSDESVILVNGNGVVTAVGEGNATVTVSFRGNDKYLPSNATIAVNVKLKDASVTADPDSLELEIGEIGKFYTETTPKDLDIEISSSNESVATVKLVNRVPTVTAVGEGTAVITVTINEEKYVKNSTTVAVTVSKIATEILIQNDTLDMEVDDVVDPVVSLMPSNAGNLSFKVSDESVILVNGNGVVTAVGGGNATVTVSFRGNDKYLPSNATIAVIVSKIATEILIQNDTLDMEVDDVVDPVVSLMPFNAGNLSFKVSDESVILVNGNGVVTAVGGGNATVTVSFRGNDKYLPSNATITVTVSKISFEPGINLNDTILTVEVPEDATGNITLIIGKETLVAPIEDGIATFDLSDVPAGDYNATITYDGDNRYEGFDVVYPISIETNFVLSAEDLIKYFHGPERFVANLTDGEDNPIVNATITITINGVDYNRTTDASGQASIAINLNSGEYPVVVTYNGTTVNATVTVLETLNGTDVVKVFRNDTQYYATFYDAEGNYLEDGTDVRFNINGVVYDRKVSGDEGLARLNINLQAGEYIITATNIVTGESTSNNIRVISRITENSDITKYYRNGTQYTVKVLGDDGNPVGAGETVKFNVNGVIYERQTNESGIAKLNINLQPGDYVITAEYKGSAVSNNIKVLPVLNASDITMKYRDGTQFKATLVDGQGKPYAEQSVTFNINGVFYNRATDGSGMAKLNINLMRGEYIITSSYNGSSISNTVKITE